MENSLTKTDTFKKFNAELLGGVIADTGRKHGFNLACAVAYNMFLNINPEHVRKLISNHAYLRDHEKTQTLAVFVGM